jgi:putative ABC transport system substrate-binding protein
MTVNIGRRQLLAALSGAAAWPLAARAQQPVLPVVGFLNSGAPTERASLVAAFRQGLAELGYIENQNVTIEYRWAEGEYARLPALITDLMRRQPTVVAVGDGPTALAAKAAISTVPVVFVSGGDVVEIGLVTSLSHPAGNLTGVNLIAGPLSGKQFGLLHELVPAAKIIGLLINPTNRNAEVDKATVEAAAHAVGVQLLVARAVAESDFETVFASLAQGHAGALVINSDVFFTSRRDRLIRLAARHGIPAMYPWREYATDGGLISYGPSLSHAFHEIGVYAARILNGTKPADLPVLQPTKFELVMNLKTARMLGLTVPPTLLAIADEIIE